MSAAPASISPPASQLHPKASSQDFYLWLDAFRALAALIVLFSHARDLVFQDFDGRWSLVPFYLATSLGRTGVILFFVLSGFWISRSVDARIAQPNFWRDYLTARLARLWTVLIPALMLGGALDYLGLFVLHLPAYQNLVGAHSLSGSIAERLNALVFVGNLLFTQTILGPVWGSNGPLWSLAYEYWYYIWYPVIMIVISRKRSIPWVLLGLSLVIAVLNVSVLFGFGVWLLGMAVQRFPFEPNITPRAKQMWLLGLTLLLLGTIAANGAAKAVIPDIVVGAVFAIQLAALRAARLPFPRIFAAVASFGRSASFSLYATHFPLVLLLAGLADGTARFAFGAKGLAVFTAVIVACVVVAYAFAMIFEKRTDVVRAQMLKLIDGVKPGPVRTRGAD